MKAINWELNMLLKNWLGQAYGCISVRLYPCLCVYVCMLRLVVVGGDNIFYQYRLLCTQLALKAKPPQGLSPLSLLSHGSCEVHKLRTLLPSPWSVGSWHHLLPVTSSSLLRCHKWSRGCVVFSRVLHSVHSKYSISAIDWLDDTGPAVTCKSTHGFSMDHLL